MTENELKKMGRRELIEIIAAMKKTELELRSKLQIAEQALADQTIKATNAGSIAEAALSLSGIFEAAQSAADTYLNSVYAANQEFETRMAHVHEEERKILDKAAQDALERIQSADQLCTDKLIAADAEIERKWEAFDQNVQRVLQSHSELAMYLQKGHQ